MENRQIEDINTSMFSEADLEAAVLGAVITDITGFGKVRDILTADMFTVKAHKLVFTACSEAYAKGEVDLMTVVQAARDNGTLVEIGGAPAVVTISQAASSAAHLEGWAYILADRHNRRMLMRTLNDMTLAVMDGGTTVDGILARVKQSVEDFARSMALGTPVAPVREGVTEAYSSLMERVSAREKGLPACGISTGLRDLDRMLGGLQPGNLYIVAGRPSMGKTAFMLHMAVQAQAAGSHVVLFSLEMSGRQIGDRMIIGEVSGSVSGDEYTRGMLSSEQVSAVEGVVDGIASRNIYVDDCGTVTMPYIQNKARRMRDEGRCDVVMIDYLQLVSPTDARRNSTREQEVSAMSRAAKLMAKDLGIPVVLLSQLSRAVEQRSDKRPLLSDLRESGSIEQDADTVIFLYRPAYYGETETAGGNPIPPGCGEAIVSKNRNGSTGTVSFRHNDSMTKIYEY